MHLTFKFVFLSATLAYGAATVSALPVPADGPRKVVTSIGYYLHPDNHDTANQVFLLPPLQGPTHLSNQQGSTGDPRQDHPQGPTIIHPSHLPAQRQRPGPIGPSMYGQDPTIVDPSHLPAWQRQSRPIDPSTSTASMDVPGQGPTIVHPSHLPAQRQRPGPIDPSMYGQVRMREEGCFYYTGGSILPVVHDSINNNGQRYGSISNRPGYYRINKTCTACRVDLKTHCQDRPCKYCLKNGYECMDEFLGMHREKTRSLHQ